MKETLRFSYRPKAWLMMLVGLFFATCGIVLGHVANNNERELVLNGIIRLNVESATALYWVLTACSVGFVILAVLGIARSFGTPGQVTLDDDTLSAPRSALSGTIVTVPLLSVTRVQVMGVSSNVFLMVHHAGGKLAINRSMMPSRADFNLLVREIEERWVGAVSRNPAVAQ